MQTQTPPTIQHQNLKSLLNEWHQIQPDCCRRIAPMRHCPNFVFYQVALRDKLFDIGCTHPWTPSQSELALIERAVQLAAESQGWTSDAVSGWLPGQAVQSYHGHVYLALQSVICYSHAIAEDAAIARLAAYLKALQGQCLGTLPVAVMEEAQ